MPAEAHLRPDIHPEPVSPAALRLRILSYNIQIGLQTRHYAQYLTGAWRHAMPSSGVDSNLDRIADVVRGYDFVAIQEADAGSLRTRSRNQMEHLARRANFPYWGYAVTRDLRPVAQHCLGYLSRFRPASIREHDLPSRIPGRRALTVQLDESAGSLAFVITHLSLGRAAQRHQLEYLSRHIPPDRPVVLLGDLNCEPDTLRHHAGLQRRGMRLAEHTPATFPSWQPLRSIDHCLVSREVSLENLRALGEVLSDHLPLSADIMVNLR